VTEPPEDLDPPAGRDGKSTSPRENGARGDGDAPTEKPPGPVSMTEPPEQPDGQSGDPSRRRFESRSRLVAATPVPAPPPDALSTVPENSALRTIPKEVTARVQAERAQAEESSIDVEFGEADETMARAGNGAQTGDAAPKTEFFDDSPPSSSRRPRIEESLESMTFGEEDVAQKSSPRHTPPPESGRQMAPPLEWAIAPTDADGRDVSAADVPVESAPTTPRRPFAAPGLATPTTPVDRGPDFEAPDTSGPEVAAFNGAPAAFTESFGSVLDQTLLL
jgi:hypothetical protein